MSGFWVLGMAFALAVSSGFSGLCAGDAAGPVTAEQAKEIVLKQTGGGDVIEMSSYYGRNGGNYFRLVIRSNNDVYTAEVDGATGELVQFIKRRGARAYQDTARPATPAPTPNTGTGRDLTMEEAMAVALQHTGGGTVVESEVDTKRRIGVIYEFEIINNGTKYDVEIVAVDGSLLEFKQKRGRYYSPIPAPRTETVPATPPSAIATPYRNSKIDATGAQHLAVGKVGGGHVTEYKLDMERGRLVHEITVVTGSRRYELEIDDESGMVRERSIKYLD